MYQLGAYQLRHEYKLFWLYIMLVVYNVLYIMLYIWLYITFLVGVLMVLWLKDA